MGHQVSRPVMEHCAGMILSHDRGPLVLSLAAETCCEWCEIAEEIARERCDTMGRKRLVESQQWRRVLGNLCPVPRADTQLAGHHFCVPCELGVRSRHGTQMSKHSPPLL